MNRPETRIDLLKKGNEQAIQEIYNEYRTGFFLFAGKYKLDNEIILDVYQDAIMALCENAQKGKLDNLKSSLKTYFFAIGKYMIFAKLRDRNKNISFEKLENIHFEWEDYTKEKNDTDVLMLQASLSKMGGKCVEILRLFYYQEKDLDEITQLMRYENKDVAKSQKSRCLKKLKELLTPN